MATAVTRTYEDYLQEASSISKDQLREMTADWRMPNSDAPVDMKLWGEPSEDEIKYFGGV
jgi:hypothetical protein